MPVETRKQWAGELQATYQVSIIMSCQVVCMSRTAYYYRKRQVDDSEVVHALQLLVERHPRWGFPKYFKRLRALGYRWNHKRVHRIYTELKLQFRSKRKQRVPARQPMPLTQPTSPQQCWSVDFMADSLVSKRKFRTFNVIDDFNRQALGIDVATSIASARVTRYLDGLALEHGYPERIRVDNGSEFTSHEFMRWATERGVYIDFIEPGSPYQNAYIERFNRTYREDILDSYLFNTLDEVRSLTKEWITAYNTERPHDSLNDMSPMEYKKWVNSTAELY
ncbi:IS3 family transposase [Oligella ureolytica]